MNLKDKYTFWFYNNIYTNKVIINTLIKILNKLKTYAN